MATTTPEFDPLTLGFELHEQLASGNRCAGFLFGAGTSICSGLPDLNRLSVEVASKLTTDQRAQYDVLRSGGRNLETILNVVRGIREILSGSETLYGLSHAAARDLDIAICRAIYEVISDGSPKPSAAHVSLSNWLKHFHSDSPVEIFTTNYDLLFESAFESGGVPYFDGFVGAVQPFFVPQSIDPLTHADSARNVPPPSWVRLWKLHGSVGWCYANDATSLQKRIVRMTGLGSKPTDEVVIFPSRDKYSESRRLPYLTYMDRLRRFLTSGERIFVVCGYSFGDEHINEVLRQALQSNVRLAMHALFFDTIPDHARAIATHYANLSALGRDTVVIGGVTGNWSLPTRKPAAGEVWHFWDGAKNAFALGDFTALGAFLGSMMRPKPLVSVAP